MICPNCSHQNDEGVRFCVQCGAPLATEAAPPPAPAQPPAYPPAPAQPAYPYPPQAQTPPPQGYAYPPPQQTPYGYPPQQPGYPPQQPGYPPPPYGYPPQGYGYPPYPSQPAVESGPWILRSLPFIGAIVAIIAFFLPWFSVSLLGTGYGSVGASGFDLVRGSIEGFIAMGQYSSYGIPGELIILLIASAALVLVPLFSLNALIFALRGNQKGRSNARVAGIWGIVLQVGYLIFLIIWGGAMAGGFSSFRLGDIFQILGYGYYLSLFGLLWMIITPSFAPKA